MNESQGYYRKESLAKEGYREEKRLNESQGYNKMEKDRISCKVETEMKRD